MDKRRQNEYDSWDDSAYGTGSTEPPRNNGGLVALLMILVICLSGVVSALGLMNIRLFKELNRLQPETAPLSFFADEEAQSTPQQTYSIPGAAYRENLPLGISGEEISPFYQRYYHMPEGLYITDVTPYSPAENLGLQAGDVLVSLNGVSVTDPASFAELLAGYGPGDRVELVIYRGGRELTLQLTLE